MQVLLKKVSGWLAGFACLVLLLVMSITFVDVIGRYFFNSPVTFAVELIQLGMGLLVLFGLAVTTFERGHIAVDVIESLLPDFFRKILASIAAICGAGFISIISWRLWDRGMKFLDDGLATDILFLPVWPWVLLMAIAAAVAAVVAVFQVFTPKFGGDDNPKIVDIEK